MPGTIALTLDASRARVAVQLNAWTTAETTVYRVQGTVRTEMRALNPARPISGTAFGYDYEVAVNQPVRYEAQDGATLVVSSTVTLTSAAQWLKAPATPAVNVRCRLARVPQLQRARSQDIIRVIGRRNPVVSSDVRSGASGTLEFVTLTSAEADDFDEFLDTADVAFVVLPNTRFGERYVQLGDATADPISPKIGEPGLRWSVPYTEVDRPIAAVSGDLTSTYDLAKTSFATYAALKTAHTSYLDMVNGLNI